MNIFMHYNCLSKVTKSILFILLSVLLLLAVFTWDMPASEASNDTDANAQENIHTTEDISDDSFESLKASDILCRDQEYSEDEIIIKFKSQVSVKSADMMLEALGSEHDTEPLLGDYVIADVPEDKTVEDFIDEISEWPEIEFVQPNYIYQLNRTVNDPFISQQWHLSQIKAFDAWDITMGDAGIKVAVIDSCVETTHPDLSAQIIASWNAVDGGSDVPDNHGTHVAGIIAAQANNGIGVAGVAPGVKLITINVFSETATTANVIKGIRYAVSNGARIINMSLGGPGYDPALESEVNAAVQSNVVVVAAAGNSNTTDYFSPSDFNSVISVIATDQSNQKASFSNYGVHKDISAPGMSIRSTVTGGAYANAQGTSMASPIVAGVAALILSVNPALTVNDVKHILYNTATDVNTPGWDEYTGHGIVNAKAAVFAVTTPSLSVSLADTASIGLVWNPIAHAAGYEIFRAPSGSVSFGHIATVSGATSWADSGLPSGTGYSYKVRAYYSEDAKTIYGAFSQTVTATTMYVPAPAPPVPPPAPPEVFDGPTGVIASAASFNSVKLAWNRTAGAKGYEVYRATSADGPFTLLRSISSRRFTDKSLIPGNTYYYRVRAYRIVSRSRQYIGGFSYTQSAEPMLGKAGSLRAKASDFNTAKITWGRVKGATGYEVYRDATGRGDYTLLGITRSRSFTDKTMEPGVAYSYIVRSYRIVGGIRAYGPYSDARSAMTSLGKMGSIKAKAMPQSISLSWKGVKGATSYEVYRSASKGGGFELIAITGSTGYTDAELPTGTTYFYRVRACRDVIGMPVYGAFSAVRSSRAK